MLVGTKMPVQIMFQRRSPDAFVKHCIKSHVSSHQKLLFLKNMSHTCSIKNPKLKLKVVEQNKASLRIGFKIVCATVDEVR